MRRTLAGLTALLVAWTLFVPESVEAGRRKRQCCQPCYQHNCQPCCQPSYQSCCCAPAPAPAPGGGIFCPGQLMMQYVDGGGVKHWMYAGEFCDGCPSPGNCTGGGYNSLSALSGDCPSGTCAPTFLIRTMSDKMGGVQKGNKLKAPVDDSVSQPLENKVTELAFAYVTFTTPDGRPKQAKLHYVFKNGKKLYTVSFGYEIKNYNGPFDSGGTSVQPDPTIPGWQVVTYQGVDFDVLTTVP